VREVSIRLAEAKARMSELAKRAIAANRGQALCTLDKSLADAAESLGISAELQKKGRRARKTTSALDDDIKGNGYWFRALVTGAFGANEDFRYHRHVELCRNGRGVVLRRFPEKKLAVRRPCALRGKGCERASVCDWSGLGERGERLVARFRAILGQQERSCCEVPYKHLLMHLPASGRRCHLA
jgi:hypothetical protein